MPWLLLSYGDKVQQHRAISTALSDDGSCIFASAAMPHGIANGASGRAARVEVAALARARITKHLDEHGSCDGAQAVARPPTRC